MKSVLFWMQVLMIGITFLFCGVGMNAVDEWLVHDWHAIAPQKVSLLAGLAGAFGICSLVWLVASLTERMFNGIRERDPDFFYEFEVDVFPSSPTKPR